MTHHLKTWPEFYSKVVTGEKSFEIRRNDRSFAVGDVLILREFDPKTDQYTGQEVYRRVVYLTDFGQIAGNVCMAIVPARSSLQRMEEAVLPKAPRLRRVK
jgi:hypothetical protein